MPKRKKKSVKRRSNKKKENKKRSNKKKISKRKSSIKKKKFKGRKKSKSNDEKQTPELIIKTRPEWIKSGLANKSQYQNKYIKSILSKGDGRGK